ncbi:MAG: vitamin K epoxide reductase family protein [Chloroflexi bacterium]|nr:vitamin K epoxide reductase family protein [Chloroflexota bacterium]
MVRVQRITLIILILVLGIFPLVSHAQAQEPVVRAVLFYSPSCGHCTLVIEEVLPALDQQYGSQLLIFGVNTYSETGSMLFERYIEAFNIPAEMQAVPTLVVGDQYLIGSGDIPENFPGIIEEGLKNGGIDWPIIEGLLEVINQPVEGEAAESEVAEGEAAETTTIVHNVTIMDRFTSDLEGNIIAVIVLLGMIFSLVVTGVNLKKESEKEIKQAPNWVIPLLSIIGIGVAGYLAYIEFNQVEAVCGPVGNCNAVQQSPYATLFGILPVGVLGVMGYIVIIIIWLAELLNLPGWKSPLQFALWVVTLFGVLFSIYLTFLEPFVIGATCMWCISSAIIMTILFLLATQKLRQAAEEDRA